MSWWLATHRAVPTAVLLMLTSSVALAAARVDLTFPVLSGAAPFAPVPVIAVLGVLCTIFVATSLAFGDEAFLWSAQRNVRALEAVHVSGAFAVVAFTCAAALLLGVSAQDAWLMLRDTVGYLSLLVIARTIGLDRYSAAVPVGYLMVASAFGRTAEGLPSFWAWPLLRGPQADAPALALSGVAAAVLIAESIGRRHLIRPRGRSGS